MKKIVIKYYIFLLVFVMLLLNSCANKRTFFNPIIKGFYPDPSICNVGDDFYLVNSSFGYFPGIPVFHSTDLVHWDQIGNVIDRAEQVDFKGLEIYQGVFAPAISYHNGLYYVITTIVGKEGNCIFTSDKPEGPWSKPVWLAEINGIDPSLFFDENGKVYIFFNSIPPDDKPLYGGHRTIRMIEFDLENNCTVGADTVIINGGTDILKKPVWIEGPHMYKVEGMYYLMCAEGGTFDDHSEVIFRSENIKGPFEPYAGNPILTQRLLSRERKYPITSTGHADIIQTKKGEWWAVFLGIQPNEPYSKGYSNKGRETFLAPVKWIDGWPVINPDFEEVQYVYEAPGLPQNNILKLPHNGNFSITYNFDNEKPGSNWLFFLTPDTDWYNLTGKPGTLIVNLLPETVKGNKNTAFIGQRQHHENFEASCELEFIPENENEFAGIIAFQSKNGFYTFGKTIINNDTVVVLNNSEETVAYKKLSAYSAINSLYLKVKKEKQYYSFFYSTDTKNWNLLADSLSGIFERKVIEEGFIGATIAMYATSNGNETNNKALYNWFKYSGYETVYNDPEFNSLKK